MHTSNACHFGGLGGADALKSDASTLGNEGDEALLLAVYQRHRHPCAARAPCAPAPVDVCLRVLQAFSNSLKPETRALGMMKKLRSWRSPHLLPK